MKIFLLLFPNERISPSTEDNKWVLMDPQQPLSEVIGTIKYVFNLEAKLSVTIANLANDNKESLNNFTLYCIFLNFVNATNFIDLVTLCNRSNILRLYNMCL